MMRAASLLVVAAALAARVAGAAERLEERVVARADPAQTYALYVPDARDGASPALLILLDPRGRGRAILEFALPHAREHTWVVLSSDGSRSDTDEAVTGRALGALLAELDRYHHDPRRVYLAGMSGTAKTLWVVAPKLRGRVAGFIGSGGGRPPELPPLRREDALPYFGYAGTTDYNLREMEALDATLATLGTPHRLAFFEGPHGWPANLVHAMAWLDLQAMRSGLAARDDAFLDTQHGACARNASEAPDVLEQVRQLDACIRDFDGVRDVAAWRTQVAALSASREHRRLHALDARLAADERRYVRRVDDWRLRFSQRSIEGVGQALPSTSESLRLLRVAALRERARDPEPRIAASARRRLAWVHAATASYLPAHYAARGDEARVRALAPLAEATQAPP